MNIDELNVELTKRNIFLSAKDICEIWGMDEASYSRKKKAGTEIKYKNIQQLEDELGIRFVKKEISSDAFQVKYYTDVFGSCGGGAFSLPETSEKIYLSKSSITNYAQFKEYFVINAIGDSMIPFIQDRDKLVIEKYNDEQIRDNRIYLFCYDDKIFIKRLVYNINELIIKSDNEQYSAITLKQEQLENNFKIIGQIVGIMRDVR